MVPKVLLSDEDVALILATPKVIADSGWRGKLLPPKTTLLDLRAKLELGELTGPVRGRIHLYSRQNLNPLVTGDWSVGLVFTDYADRTFRVLRCNGPHPSDHRNTIEGSMIIRTAHIHRLTERYQSIGRPDGFAEPTDRYSTITAAVEVLAELIHLHVDGRLFV